jgi:hypothetical protein
MKIIKNHEAPSKQDVVRLLRTLAEQNKNVPENQKIHHERYHGHLKDECCLVKKRTEVVKSDSKVVSTLDIYTCLAHPHVECLRSGWEVGWYGGTNSREL